MKTRKCRKCGGIYTLDKFVKHKTSLFGRLHKCKECKNKACRDREAYYKKYPYANHYHSGKQRCNYPKHNRYKYYGGKGIKRRVRMDKTDIFGEFGLWVWGKSIPTDVDKCQIFMRQSPLGEYIKMFQAENKKLEEQQLTEDAIAEIVLQTNKDWDNYEGFDNFELFIAKAIIKAIEEKQTRTCDPECPFCKTEEASK